MFAAGVALAGPLEDGHTAYLRGDIDTALSLWTPLAEQGNADAQYMLGLIYFNGRYVEKNDDEAAKWLQLSAAQGNSDAELLLGVLAPVDTGQAEMSQGSRK
jgi:TPR repeat protein